METSDIKSILYIACLSSTYDYFAGKEDLACQLWKIVVTLTSNEMLKVVLGSESTTVNSYNNGIPLVE